MTSPPVIDSQFPAGQANEMARLECYNKHHYRPNSYLHKWWARRCGSTFRLILKGLADDPAQRDYYAAGGLDGKLILDPMMGGGTTLHEAVRLGANVIGADLDPIPVLQARASLTRIELGKLENAFTWLMSRLREELSPLFRTACPACARPVELQFVLYGAERRCGCGPAVLVDSLALRHESDGTIVRLCPHCHAVVRGDAACQCPPAHPRDSADARPPIVERKRRTCPTCGQRYREDTRQPYYTRYRPLAVVATCPEHGVTFAAPSPADLDLLAQANAARPDLPAEQFAVLPGPKSADLLRRGIHSYLDLFTSRQLLYLQHAIRLLPGVELEAVHLNLGLLISTSLEFNALLCGYKGGSRSRPGAIRHTFAHHAYSFPYTALENNPLYPQRSSGTLEKLFHDRVRRARRWAERPVERDVRPKLQGRPGKVAIESEVDWGHEVHTPADLNEGARRFFLIQGSSAQLPLDDSSVDAVVTDPPYYDSVQYSDLAQFFHVWLARLLPEAADWAIDLRQSAVDPHTNGGPEGQYTAILSQILAECGRVLKKEHGRLVFTYHHWNPLGWAALTLALKRAGFRLVNRYVVLSENPVSVHIANLRSLKHDAVLVLAPAGAEANHRWPPQQKVDTADSYRFCQDCASVLGWLLESDLSEADLVDHWLHLLR